MVFFLLLEDDIDDDESREQKTQHHRDDHDTHDELLDRYESDNGDYKPMSESENASFN